MSKTRNEKKRDKALIALYAAVAVWAVIVTALLLYKLGG